mgnify:CR=1 FL=1
MKRSIPIDEALGSRREETPIEFTMEHCVFPLCHSEPDERLGGLAVCERHADLVFRQNGRKRSKPKPPPPRRENRHGVPLRGKEPGKCRYANCVRAVSQYTDMEMCDTHVHQVAREIKFREPNLFIIVKTEKPPRRTVPKTGLIYYLEDDGLIKIGWTSNLQRRMRQFLPNHKLLAVEPGTRSDERRIHRKFAVHLTHGNEWFAAVPSIRKHIEMVKARHGEPPADITVGPNPASVPVVRAKEYTSLRRRSAWGGTRSWGFETSKT